MITSVMPLTFTRLRSVARLHCVVSVFETLDFSPIDIGGLPGRTHVR